MKRIAILLVTTGIAGVASAHQEPSPRGCSAIEVTAPGLRKQPRGLQFSTREVLDLAFETELERQVYGEHLLHFKVFTPSGFLYQDLAMPFNWKRPRRGPHEREAVVPAASVSPSGLPVQQLGTSSPDGRGRGRQSVEARLPVAGTSITMSTLYGRWSVQAFLDDHARPCSPASVFTISSK
jgi:hypothetical protein